MPTSKPKSKPTRKKRGRPEKRLIITTDPQEALDRLLGKKKGS